MAYIYGAMQPRRDRLNTKYIRFENDVAGLTKLNIECLQSIIGLFILSNSILYKEMKYNTGNLFHAFISWISNRSHFSLFNVNIVLSLAVSVITFLSLTERLTESFRINNLHVNKSKLFQTQAYFYASAHIIYSRANTHINLLAGMYAQTLAYKYLFLHTSARLHIYTHTHTHTHTHTYTHTPTHTYIHKYMHTHIHSHACINIYARAHNIWNFFRLHNEWRHYMKYINSIYLFSL